MAAASLSLTPPALSVTQKSDRTLGVSVAVSAALHLSVIVALASLSSTLSLIPSRVGLTSPLAVELIEPEQRLPTEVLEPLTPLTAVDPVRPMEPLPVVRPSTAPPVTDDSAITQLNLPEYTRAGPPTPEGRVAVGPLTNPEHVSMATAARLAQRFPVAAARPPRLNGAVITDYPRDAAQAHISARVAAILTIDLSGQIVAADTRLIPDNPMFRPAILAALAHTTFIPAEAAGKPIAYWAILLFNFDIDPFGGPRRQASGR